MPVEHTGTAVAGYKLLAAIVTVLSPVVGFLLGLKVIPLSEKNPNSDLFHRLLGCVASSLVLGAFALVYLYHSQHWVFTSAWEIGDYVKAGEVGVIWLIGAVLLVCALPGWWLVGAVVRSMAGWEGKDVRGVLQDVGQTAAEISGVFGKANPKQGD